MPDVGVERRHREALARALIGPEDAAAPAEGGQQDAVTGGQLPRTQRGELEAHVEHLFGGVHADGGELAEDGVVGSIEADEPAGVRQRGAAARLGRPALEHYHGLPRPARRRQRVDESCRVGQPFGVDGDDTRALVVDQGAHEVGEAEHGLVPAADGDPETEAELLRPGMGRHRGAAALAHHRHRARDEVVDLAHQRAERRREPDGGVDDADAVRSAQLEARAAADLFQLPLSRAALGVGLREPASPDDGCRHPRGKAVPDHRHHRLRRHRDDRLVGHRRKRGQAREAAQAPDDVAAGVDRPDGTPVPELLEEADGEPAQVALAVRGADDGHGSRRQERRQVAEGARGRRAPAQSRLPPDRLPAR